MSGQLFHVQHVSETVVNTFYPRIPEGRMLFEDDVLPRICLSSTIQGAIKGSQVLYRDYQKGFYNSVKGMFLRVYLFNQNQIKQEYLLTPEEIYEEVPDALFTREHWYLDQLVSTEIFHVFVEATEIKLGEEILHEVVRFEIIERIGGYNENHSEKNAIPC